MQLAGTVDDLALRQLSIVFGVDALPVDVRQAATVS
jgi:hypothetical protein